MIVVNDSLGNRIELNQSAKRIVTLVPSQTELLYYFGLDEETVGITKFCIHPDSWFRSKVRVGGTKNVDIEKVKALKPDLIIANKEENTQSDIELLASFCPVYVSDVNDLNEALRMIKDVGVLCGCEQKAVDLIDDIQDDFQSFPNYSGSVVYFIWKDPYMVCGTKNFIHSMIEKLGFENCILTPRYVELCMDELHQINPDYIFLSTEPFPFKEEHKNQFGTLADRVRIVDGEMFSWYGSRMLKMKAYFQSFLD